MNVFQKITAYLRRVWENFFRDFRKKTRISAHDPHGGQERWYIFLSPLNILTALLALVVVLFVTVVTIVAFTPVLDLIPGYPGNRTRNLLIEYNMKLDSLENELLSWDRYHENLTRIMDGQAPLTAADPQPDSARSEERGDIPRIPEDTELRAQMEGTGPYALQPTATDHANLYPEMYPPVKGVVISKFDPRAGRFGTNIAGTENQPVMAMLEGVVINASWTPEDGYALYILHPDNLISACLHNASLTKKTGDRVYSGEVVGFSSSFTEVQIWMDGTPVDPENYLIF